MRIIFLILLVSLAAFWWCQRPIARADGVLIRGEPTQVLLSGENTATTRDGFTIRPLAGYIIEARVLHTKHYLSDTVHNLAPYDVGLGWGPMSDTGILKKLTLSQSNRFLFWEWQNQSPLPQHELETHASNNHLIAANANIARQIAWLREGELIRLEGSLIEATARDGHKWTSSLSRDDTGNGACEIMWVSKLTKL
ncbi:MAG: hypothetical protein ABIT76_07610 [Chthoniobacterales bacterium]